MNNSKIESVLIWYKISAYRPGIIKEEESVTVSVSWSRVFLIYQITSLVMELKKLNMKLSPVILCSYVYKIFSKADMIYRHRQAFRGPASSPACCGHQLSW